MNINVTLVGDRELIARLDSMPREVRQMLRQKVRSLALRLKARIQRDKLSGQVLNVVTGALRRSIHDVVKEDTHSVTGEVRSSGDVKYAGIHEFGGRTKAHIIEPRKKDALAFMLGGKMVFAKRVNHPGSKMPERSYMRSALSEMAPTIQRELREAVIQGLLKGSGGKTK